MLCVDRATLYQWGLQGMPSLRDGREVTYAPAACFHWMVGRECRARNGSLRDVSMTPSQQIAVGWVLGCRGRVDAEGKAIFISLMHAAGVGESDALAALGFGQAIYAICY